MWNTVLMMYSGLTFSADTALPQNRHLLQMNLFIVYPRSGVVYDFGGVVCMSVCLSVCNVITFESLDIGN